jgi:hypothetical protein
MPEDGSLLLYIELVVENPLGDIFIDGFASPNAHAALQRLRDKLISQLQYGPRLRGRVFQLDHKI